VRSAQGWGCQHSKPAIISGRYIGELGYTICIKIARWAAENGLEELVEDGEFNGQTTAPEDRFARLSPRENQVLAMLVEGVRYKEMARRLELGPKTICTHRRALMSKLDIQNIAGLVKASIRRDVTAAPHSPKDLPGYVGV
jgi:DNA-binding NarL/FixJ family response regulator